LGELALLNYISLLNGVYVRVTCKCACAIFSYYIKYNKTGNVCIKVTLWCVRVTIVAVEKQYVLHILRCVCNLTCPASKSYAPYYVNCGLSGSTILFHVIS
jgi:hypothetical protein